MAADWGNANVFNVQQTGCKNTHKAYIHCQQIAACKCTINVTKINPVCGK